MVIPRRGCSIHFLDFQAVQTWVQEIVFLWKVDWSNTKIFIFPYSQISLYMSTYVSMDHFPIHSTISDYSIVTPWVSVNASHCLAIRAGFLHVSRFVYAQGCKIEVIQNRRINWNVIHLLYWKSFCENAICCMYNLPFL